MAKLIDLTGQKFNMLTVLERASGSYKAVHWKCVCDCGTETIAEGNKIKNGHTKSCGCLHSKTVKRLRQRKNTFELIDDSYYLVTDAKGDTFLVDIKDVELLIDKYWFVTPKGYVTNTELGLLHRFLTNAPEDKDVDHRNHNRADNRRENLLVVTHMENMWNMKATNKNTATGYKGITFDENTGKYRARIYSNGKRKHLGVFDTVEEAISARIDAEKSIQGTLTYDWEDDKNE